MNKSIGINSASPLVDVVIVNYNAGQYVIDLVKLLQNNRNLKVVVVDNGSTDGSLQSLQNLGVQVVSNQENRGFAAACNQGAECGNAEFIAFVNPDCLIKPGQIEDLVDRHCEQSVGLMGCHVVDLDGKTQRGTWRRLPNLWRVLLTVSGLEKIFVFQGLNLNAAPQVPEAVNGACYTIKRHLFENLKGFDECYPLHFEDLDLFKRILDSGQNLGYAEDISVNHVKGHSSTDSEQVKVWKKLGLLRYFKKHRPGWEHKLIRLLVGLK